MLKAQRLVMAEPTPEQLDHLHHEPPMPPPPNLQRFRVPRYVVEPDPDKTSPIPSVDLEHTTAIDAAELLGPPPSTYRSNGDRTSKRVTK
jgi:hypothetical protein